MTTTTATITSTMTTSGMNYKLKLKLTYTYCSTSTYYNQYCYFTIKGDLSLVAGVSVAVTAIITSIITAIVHVSSIITYWCCVKRTSSYETPVTTTVDVQSNVAYGHVSGGKIPSTAVYESVSTDL